MKLTGKKNHRNQKENPDPTLINNNFSWMLEPITFSIQKTHWQIHESVEIAFSENMWCILSGAK